MWFSASCSLFYFLCRKTNYSFPICARASSLVGSFFFLSSLGFITLSNCTTFCLELEPIYLTQFGVQANMEATPLRKTNQDVSCWFDFCPQPPV